jgi:hypothetical protein
MGKPTSRIGGDFNQEAVDAFRVAYIHELSSPSEDGIANNSGLPTNTISNTSPWIEHTGLWKYPSGRGPDQDLKSAFDPNAYLSGEMVDGEEVEETELGEEETETIINEVLHEVGEQTKEEE